jgi:hypothetical protein
VVAVAPVVVVPESVAARAVIGERRIAMTATREMIGDLIWIKR